MANQNKKGKAFITTKKGFCYLAIKYNRRNFRIMRIRNYRIDPQDKRDMRRLYPEIDFEWKKLAAQLEKKKGVCWYYRSRRRRARAHREPFYGTFDPIARTVFVNDASNIGGVAAMLDMILEIERAENS